MRFRLLLILALCLSLFSATNYTAAEKSVLDRISSESIKAHVAFLASDALEGRDTPSRGLDVAAEYIASHFRRLKLEPAGANGSYFQIAPYAKVTQPLDGYELTLTSGERVSTLSKDRVGLTTYSEVNLQNLTLVKVDVGDDAALQALKSEDVAGKALFMDTASLFSAPQDQRMTLIRKAMSSRTTLMKLKPALLLSPGFGLRPQTNLRDLSAPELQTNVPMVQVHDTEFVKMLREAEPGVRLNAKLPAPVLENVELKNVVAVLRGSDPVLKDTYVLVTAHYDHVGVASSGDGDRIRNGANDNASGTSTVLELADAMARSGYRPKRSIVFMLYFGEEKGLFGSRYYARKPVFPLAKTVANLNLEQLGRTDDPEGDRTNKLTATGFTYTSIGSTLLKEAPRAGVEAWNDEKNSDAYFSRSDNQALADAGVPAVTLGVAWSFSDYHRPGDHWDKLNYDHMANIAHAIALTTLAVADDPEAPKWIESNPKTAKYVEAAKKLHEATH